MGVGFDWNVIRDLCMWYGLMGVFICFVIGFGIGDIDDFFVIGCYVWDCFV